MPLVELIRAHDTSDESVEAVRAVAAELGADLGALARMLDAATPAGAPTTAAGTP